MHFSCVCGKFFSHVQLFVTLWIVVCQASLSMGCPRQEYWRGLSCPPAGYLPNPGIKLTSLMSPSLEGRFFTTSGTWETLVITKKISNSYNFSNTVVFMWNLFSRMDTSLPFSLGSKSHVSHLLKKVILKISFYCIP